MWLKFRNSVFGVILNSNDLEVRSGVGISYKDCDLSRLQTENVAKFVVHYACGSFDEIDRPVTSIAITGIQGTRDARDFSIVDFLDLQPSDADITRERFLNAEKKLISAFIDYLKSKKNSAPLVLLHWNMRDTLYGFPAIENRCEIHNIDYDPLSDVRKIDIPQQLIESLGLYYTSRSGRMRALIELNNLGDPLIRYGKDEAVSIEGATKSALLTVKRSVLLKVNKFADLVDLYWRKELRFERPGLIRRSQLEFEKSFANSPLMTFVTLASFVMSVISLVVSMLG